MFELQNVEDLFNSRLSIQQLLNSNNGEFTHSISVNNIYPFILDMYFYWYIVISKLKTKVFTFLKLSTKEIQYIYKC